MRRKYVVIYTRYSSDLQRTASCEDQEREVRGALARRGLDITDAVVLRDEAESGTRSDRDSFQRLLDMIAAGEVRVLAVDDQSRLTRAENALALIKDLVYSGGRFVSASENIDTDEPGWQLKVKVLELHHSETIRGLRDKVRRGQRGRVLADGSAGDFPYGYASYYHAADWQQQLARRGPKPTKGIRVDDAQADWVRTAFAWFVGGESINGIARRLTAAGAPKGRRATTPGWHPQQVRRILTNPKYVGRWRWGETTTIRDSRGRSKQVPAPPGEAVVRDRSDLRIVEQDVWDRAQARLREFRDTFGWKAGQAVRGPKPPANPAAVYPRTVLGGVLRCGACGRPMWYKGSGGRRYYACSGYAAGRCDQSFQVPAAAAAAAVVGAITRRVADWPDWVRQVHVLVTETLVRAARQVPAERAEAERRLAELTRQHDNLIDAVAQGDAPSTGLVRRIAAIEVEVGELQGRLVTLRDPTDHALEPPTEQWVREQLDDWARSLADTQMMGRAIREALVRVDARPVVAPGKKRGYPELTLHFRAWELYRAAVGRNLPAAVAALLTDPADATADATDVIALGGPTPMDRWAPEIARWRQEGATWEEIARRTGMDLSRVYLAWKRYADATGPA